MDTPTVVFVSAISLVCCRHRAILCRGSAVCVQWNQNVKKKIIISLRKTEQIKFTKLSTLWSAELQSLPELLHKNGEKKTFALTMKDNFGDFSQPKIWHWMNVVNALKVQTGA